MEMVWVVILLEGTVCIRIQLKSANAVIEAVRKKEVTTGTRVVG